jgi:hypothetical protein
MPDASLGGTLTPRALAWHGRRRGQPAGLMPAKRKETHVQVVQSSSTALIWQGTVAVVVGINAR